MKFEFWLISDTVELLLPVTPKSYSRDYGNAIETLGATGIGDVNVVGHRRLETIKLTSFFTVKEDTFVNIKTYPASHALDYVQLIYKWINEKAIIRHIVTEGDKTRINGLFYIESIIISEDNTTNGDIDYTLILREFRSMKTAEISTNMNVNRKREVLKKPKTKTYTVVEGDYLRKIARKVYGDAEKWEKIYKANKEIIGKNPNLIFAGQTYTIT